MRCCAGQGATPLASRGHRRHGERAHGMQPQKTTERTRAAGRPAPKKPPAVIDRPRRRRREQCDAEQRETAAVRCVEWARPPNRSDMDPRRVRRVFSPHLRQCRSVRRAGSARKSPARPRKRPPDTCHGGSNTADRAGQQREQRHVQASALRCPPHPPTTNPAPSSVARRKQAQQGCPAHCRQRQEVPSPRNKRRTAPGPKPTARSRPTSRGTVLDAKLEEQRRQQTAPTRR